MTFFFLTCCCSVFAFVRPSRANTDAINVHPIEFVLGEYNHLLAIYLYSSCVTPIHPLSCILFMVVAGLMAGFNHTRFDMVWEMFGIQIFDSKAHDVHHRIPQSNYGQYTMLWDYIFGSYRYVQKQEKGNRQQQPTRLSHTTFSAGPTMKTTE